MIEFTDYTLLNLTESQHAVFTSTLILIEAALVADLVFNKHWEEAYFWKGPLNFKVTYDQVGIPIDK